MVANTTKTIILEVLGGILYVLAAIALFSTVILASGPVSINLLRGHVEQSLTKARQGLPVTIADLALKWSPGKRRLLLMTRDVSFKDQHGNELGHFSHADLTLNTSSLLFGKLETNTLNVQNGWIDIHSKQSNQWSIIGNSVSVPELQELPQTLTEWTNHINDMLGDQLAVGQHFSRTTTVRQISFENVDIRVLSPTGETLAGIDAAGGHFENTGYDLTLTLSGNGLKGPIPEIFSVTLATSDNGMHVYGNLDIGALPIAALAKTVGLNELDQGTFFVGTSFALTASRDEGIHEIKMVMTGDDGQLSVPAIDETITGIDTALTYHPRRNILIIDRFNLKGRRFETAFSGQLAHVPADSQALRFRLDADTLRFDLADNGLEKAWTLTDTTALVELAANFRQVTFEHVTANVNGSRVEANGKIGFPATVRDGQLPLRLDAEAVVTNTVSKETVLQFWPLRFLPETRDYIAKNLQRGTVTGGRAHIALGPDSLNHGVLRDEAINVVFEVEDGHFRFLDDFPAVTDARSTGRLTGNSFTIVLQDGQYGDWILDNGQVVFPQLSTKKPLFTVQAEGNGPVESILHQLAHSHLRLQENTRFDLKRISGKAQAVFTMTYPLFGKAELDDVMLSLRGKVTDGRLRAAVGNLDFYDASVDVDLTQESLHLAGSGKVGGTSTQFEWHNSFNDAAGEARLSARSAITPDIFNTFGVASRAFFSGNIPLTMDGTIRDDRLQKAKFFLDLDDITFELDAIDWRKPAGNPFDVHVHYSRDPNNGKTTLTLQADGEDNQLDSVFHLTKAGQLDAVSLRRLILAGVVDIAADMHRSDTDGFVINLSGPFLNVKSLLAYPGGFGTIGQSGQLPLSLDARIGQVALKGDRMLTDVRFQFRRTQGGFDSMTLNSQSDGGARLTAHLKSDGPDLPLDISVTSEDAGFITTAFFGNKSVQGGQFDLSGTMPHDDQPANLLVRIRDIRLKNAPILTQILSLPSLQGLVDTLAGDGILFTRMEIPVTFDKQGYQINSGRANGPALGLTINGKVSTGPDKAINISGVLVPGFRLNSLLGPIPIIGDISVGRKGEGIFSIQYSVTGTLDAANVMINPLTMVTPGILRRIFDPIPSPDDNTPKAQ